MTKQKQSKTDIELLYDPNVFTFSIEVTARLLGVQRQTLHGQFRNHGEIMKGVPVIKIGKRQMVQANALRAALGITLQSNT